MISKIATLGLSCKRGEAASISTPGRQRRTDCCHRRSPELQLLRGDTPVIAVENASRQDARSVCSTVATMVKDFALQSLKSPAVLVIGEAMRERAVQLAGQATEAALNANTKIASVA